MSISDEFNSWLLSVEKVSKWTYNNCKDICFGKVKENFLKFQYSLPLEMFPVSPLKTKLGQVFENGY